MKLQTAEHIIPRITAVTSIKRDTPNGKQIVGYSSRCDCSSREDHLFMIDGPIAHEKALRHALYHNCRKGVTPWAGNLSK